MNIHINSSLVIPFVTVTYPTTALMVQMLQTIALLQEICEDLNLNLNVTDNNSPWFSYYPLKYLSVFSPFVLPGIWYLAIQHQKIIRMLFTLLMYLNCNGLYNIDNENWNKFIIDSASQVKTFISYVGLHHV